MSLYFQEIRLRTRCILAEFFSLKGKDIWDDTWIIKRKDPPRYCRSGRTWLCRKHYGDEALLEAAGILEYEKVQIVDVNNGSRFETYTISGQRGSGMICLNGAAARCVSTGDKIIIMAYGQYTPDEAKEHKPAVVFVDEKNQISRVTNYERHGLLKDMDT